MCLFDLNYVKSIKMCGENEKYGKIVLIMIAERRHGYFSLETTIKDEGENTVVALECKDRNSIYAMRRKT